MIQTWVHHEICPIIWKSQFQTEIALSSMKSEYTGLSYKLREAIPIMDLLTEMKRLGFVVIPHQAQVHCHVFEDNSGALEMTSFIPDVRFPEIEPNGLSQTSALCLISW